MWKQLKLITGPHLLKFKQSFTWKEKSCDEKEVDLITQTSLRSPGSWGYPRRSRWHSRFTHRDSCKISGVLLQNLACRLQGMVPKSKTALESKSFGPGLKIPLPALKAHGFNRLPVTCKRHLEQAAPH